MLVLKRRMNERVLIGDSIQVVVVEVGCGWVRLGFEAPDEVPVHREEVLLAIQNEIGKETPIPSGAGLLGKRAARMAERAARLADGQDADTLS